MPERLQRRIGHRLELRDVGDVGGLHQRTTPLRLDLARDRVEIAARARGQHDIGAVGGVFERDGAAQSLAGAGDDADLALQR